MANLTVKDLPDSVYNQLKEAARSEGRSLNSHIVSLLKADAEERNRRKFMRESRNVSAASGNPCPAWRTARL